MNDMVTIYHNPKCGTSRKALALIREAGVEPEVVDYMKAGWEMGALRALIDSAGMTARQALRAKELLAQELGLEGAQEEVILEAMVAHPVLVNRPIVRTRKGVKLCRPAEDVLGLL